MITVGLAAKVKVGMKKGSYGKVMYVEVAITYKCEFYNGLAN
jgi:hypothetical protein